MFDGEMEYEIVDESRVRAVMIGDDRVHEFDVDEMIEVEAASARAVRSAAART